MHHGELLKLLREEPFVPLCFSTDIIKKGPPKVRVQTPWTPCFESALHFRSLTRNVLNLGGSIVPTNATMAEQARKDREARSQLGRDAVSRIRQEFARRSSQPAKEPPEETECILMAGSVVMLI
jgi:hypothetical protein